jgi:hypothetical protein
MKHRFFASQRYVKLRAEQKKLFFFMPKRSNFTACSAKITKNAENQERQFKNLPFLCSLTFIMQHGVCKDSNFNLQPKEIIFNIQSSIFNSEAPLRAGDGRGLKHIPSCT